jgi:Protein of unknown function (DUF2786)
MTDAAKMDLGRILTKVQKLIAVAEHPTTSAVEAQAFREQGDALMLKFAIDRAMLEESRPAQDRGQPITSEFALAGADGIAGWVASMLTDMAVHCRCKVRHFTRYDRDSRQWYSTVYGFESDVRYLEIMFTTVRLHMLGILAPKVSDAESLDENAYRLHGAGYNWLEIAKMYGWIKVAGLSYEVKKALQSQRPNIDWSDREYWRNQGTGEVETNTQVGSRVKRAYERACKIRGEKPTKIAANGSETYRYSACQGYISKIAIRLRQMKAASDREAGQSGAVVLASQASRLEDFFREGNKNLYTRCPRCQKLSSNPFECEYCGQFIKDRPEPCERCAAAKSGRCRGHSFGKMKDAPFSRDAYAAGSKHAESADLGGAKLGDRKALD